MPQKHVLVVLSNPRDGRDDEYNQWYDEVHLADVLQVKGFVSAQRFHLGPPLMGQESPWKYLSLYQIETDDLEATFQELVDLLPNIVISEAINLKTLAAYAFTPRAEPMFAAHLQGSAT